ncbi:MAG TPA: dihydrodipicolinate synthase family protein, partial [Solirubrobacterales bacterium]
PQMREIFDAASEDDHDRALEIERGLADIYTAISAAPPASSVKAILSMQGLIGETQRLPMVPVAGPARDVLAEIAEASS